MPVPSSPPLALIVDDMADNRDIFRMAVEMAGYNVISATNGKEALDILGKRNIHLMLLDLDMPVLNGRDLLKTLESQGEHMPAHIIVITANIYMATETVSHLADYVINKPFEVRSLVTLAERLKTVS